MEVKEFINEVIADGAIIGDNVLGIVEHEGTPIVPKNLMVSFDYHDECRNNEDCDDCPYGGCCNNVEYEFATISKIGGKQTVEFVRWIGHQPGSVYTRWQRCYNNEK